MYNATSALDPRLKIVGVSQIMGGNSIHQMSFAKIAWSVLLEIKSETGNSQPKKSSKLSILVNAADERGMN